MLDEIDGLDLEQEATEGLRHRANLETVTSVRHGREYRETPGFGPEVKVLLTDVSASDREIAAARGVVAQRWVRFPLGTTVRPGQTWRIQGTTKRVAWTRRVTITGDPDPVSRLFVLATAADAVATDANQ